MLPQTSPLVGLPPTFPPRTPRGNTSGHVDAGLDEKVYILAGLTPAKSDKALKYMQTVPGMKVPDDLIKRMAGAEDKKAEGVKITVEMIQAIREIKGVAGVHVMAIAWESIVPEIVEKAGLLPRPRVG